MSAYLTQIQALGPIAHWTCGDTAGATQLADSGGHSGGPFNMTLNSAGTHSVLGYPSLLPADTGTCLYLDGTSTSSYATLADNAAFDWATAHATIIAWALLIAPGANAVLINKSGQFKMAMLTTNETSLTVASCSLTGGSQTVTASAFLGVQVGHVVSDPNGYIPPGTTVIGMTPGATPSITLSAAPSTSGTETLTFKRGEGGFSTEINTKSDTGPQVPQGVPYMYALRYDGTNIYTMVNGQEDSGTAFSTAVSAGTGLATTIGQATGNTWAGYVQHVSVFSSTLTQAQIQDLYVRGMVGAYPLTGPENGMVFNWSVPVVPANSARKRLTIVNDSDAIMFASLGGTAAVNTGRAILPYGGRMITSYQGQVSLIHEWPAWTKNVTIQEEL